MCSCSQRGVSRWETVYGGYTMPRARRIPSTAGRQAYESLWAQQLGTPLKFTVEDWDPDMATLGQAILEIVATGASVFVRSGQAGASLGIAIWEGDERHPATWFGEPEELNAWSAGILKRAEAIKAKGQE